MNDRFHSQMSKEDFDAFIAEHKITWKQLQLLPQIINDATDKLFDIETQNQADILGKSMWERRYETIAKALRKLHLLRIPTHYTSDNKLYIIRQECEYLLFGEEQELGLERLNDSYNAYKKVRKGSNERKRLEEVYNQRFVALRAIATGDNEFSYFNFDDSFHFIKDDDAKWLDSF